MAKLMSRSEVPVEQTWNLETLFPSTEAWEAELLAIEGLVSSVTQYKGRFTEGASILLACLTAYEALFERVIRAGTYASLRMSEDGTNPANQAAAAKAGSLQARIGGALSFVESEILLLPGGAVERYLKEEPGLEVYRIMLEQVLERKPHALHPETEAALAALSEVTGSPYTVYQRSKSSDMRFDPIHIDGQELPVSFSTYEEKLEIDPNVETRRAAFASFTEGLKKYRNTFAATFATEVKKNVVMAKLRGYESATHMLLHPQKVTMEMYTNVLDIIQQEVAPHMRRYARLRKRVLGLDNLLYPDIEAPLDPAFNPPVTYEEATRIILEALSVMGPEYVKIMRTALTERWVDWASNIGKSTGAFCSSPYGGNSFILVSWAGTMRNVLILAHELGHAGHFQLANKHQRLVNTRPSMFFVEGPSTINELLVGQHIMAQNPDPRMKRWVIMQFLSTYHHNFVRHLLEGELQRRIYALAEKGTPITEVTLSTTKGEILEQFWGGEVEITEGAKLTWMRQPHYYMGLYPYTYSAGLTAATAMAQSIKEEGQPAVERWLTALKAGGTLKPLELMQLAGIDMSKPDPIRKAVAYVGSLVDELEKSFS